MTETTKKSSNDLLYIPSGFLSRTNINPTKRDILCFAPFAGKEITRANLEIGVCRILQTHGYARPMNIGKMLIGQYENRYGCIFNISEPDSSVVESNFDQVSFDEI